MSEEKKTPAKNTQPGKAAKILNWFKTLPQRIAKPFKNMFYELKKVTWPSKQRLISFSIIVLVFMLFMSVVIGLLDLGASAGVRSLISATSGSAAATAVPAAEEAAETAETAAEEAAETVEETAEAVKDAAEEAAETAENAAGEAAETVKDAAEEAAKTVENAAEEAAEAATDASEGK